MGRATTRSLVALAIMGFCMTPASLTSCGGNDAAPDATDATYGSTYQDVLPIEASTQVVCAPVLPDAWTPPPFVPPFTDNQSCTHQQVGDFDQACFATNGSSSACSSFLFATENATCAKCLYSQYGDSPRGAVYLLPDNLYRTNFAGCIALVDGDFSENGCGAQVQALIDCEDAACSTDVCPINTSSSAAENDSIKQLDSCERQADRNICLSAYNAALCSRTSKYDRCAFGSDFEASVVGIGDFMCASGSIDDAGNSDLDAAAE